MDVSDHLKAYVSEIIKLSPNDEELYQFVRHLEKHNSVKDVVSWSNKEYMGSKWPRVHDTTGVKPGGKLHIDYGFSVEGFSCYLRLDEHVASEFIEFIKESRDSNEILG